MDKKSEKRITRTSTIKTDDIEELAEKLIETMEPFLMGEEEFISSLPPFEEDIISNRVQNVPEIRLREKQKLYYVRRYVALFISIVFILSGIIIILLNQLNLGFILISMGLIGFGIDPIFRVITAWINSTEYKHL